MIARVMTFSYLTPRSAEDKMLGTQIAEHGVLQTGQRIEGALGPFILGRAQVVEQFPKTISARQRERLFERARKEPEQFLQSEGFRMFEADRSLKEKMRQNLIKKEIKRWMKGRDRNSPCPCGSGKKYKKCHGQR
jgi:hypothetical protein